MPYHRIAEAKMPTVSQSQFEVRVSQVKIVMVIAKRIHCVDRWFIAHLKNNLLANSG
jgi:hypothetical protein